MAFVTLEQRGHVGIMTIDRQEALNALNSQVLTDLDAAVDQVKTTRKSMWSSSPARAAPSWPGPTLAK